MSDDTSPPQVPDEDAAAPSTPGGAAAVPSPPPAYSSDAGSMPPPPPAYGASPTSVGAYSAVEAIQYGWAKFTKSPGSLLVPALIFIVVMIVVEVILNLVIGHTVTARHDCTRNILGSDFKTTCGPGMLRVLLGAGIVAGIATFFSSVLSAGLIKSALNVADGHEVNIGDVLGFATKPAVVSTAVLIAVATGVGTFLFYLPGIIVGILTAFAMYFVVDKNLDGMSAIMAGISFLKDKIGDLIVFYILAAVCVVVGAILCGIGLLVAIPVVLGGAAYTFRVLHHEPVSPAA